MYSGDTHAALMGMVYGLPRVVLAEFENGAAAEAASEELVRAFESWDGRLLLLLDASGRRGLVFAERVFQSETIRCEDVMTCGAESGCAHREERNGFAMDWPSSLLAVGIRGEHAVCFRIG